MPIPDFQSIMLPLLRSVSDGSEHPNQEIVERLAGEFHLTPEERQHLLPSGTQATFVNRVAWAKSHLVQAGLLEATKRAHYKITSRGEDILNESPPRIDMEFLLRFPEYVAFRRRGSTTASDSSDAKGDISRSSQSQTPEELIRDAVKQTEAALAKDLLDRVLAGSPTFFESLIVKLLLAMGYGDSRSDAGQIVGKSGDHGIDGIIDQDSLGLDRVYIQAKKYAKDCPVSEPEIRGFSGSLGAAKANKGVFVTSSFFTQPAREFADRHPFKIVLIDGDKLTDLMIRFNVGARTDQTIYLKKIDEDLFLEE